MTHVSVDPERCTGHGRCYSLAPDIYDADDVGHSVVLIDEVSGDFEQRAAIGQQNCPERAITLSH